MITITEFNKDGTVTGLFRQATSKQEVWDHLCAEDYNEYRYELSERGVSNNITIHSLNDLTSYIEKDKNG